MVCSSLLSRPGHASTYTCFPVSKVQVPPWVPHGVSLEWGPLGPCGQLDCGVEEIGRAPFQGSRKSGEGEAVITLQGCCRPALPMTLAWAWPWPLACLLEGRSEHLVALQ